MRGSIAALSVYAPQQVEAPERSRDMDAAQFRNLFRRQTRARLCELRCVASRGCRADRSYYATGFEAACDCHRDASVSAVRGRLRVARTPCGEDGGDMSCAPRDMKSLVMLEGLERACPSCGSNPSKPRPNPSILLPNSPKSTVTSANCCCAFEVAAVGLVRVEAV